MSKENLIDDIILLLSTDWFFDYWPAIGIGIEKRKKALLQTGCRAIVKQILSTKLGPVENYHMRDFTEDRLACTRTLLLELVNQHGLDECEQAAIFSALEKKRYSNNSLYRIRVLEDITALVVEDRLNDTEAHLAEPIKQVLLSAWHYKLVDHSEDVLVSDIANFDFEFANLNSPSAWDGFIRSLTSDQHSMLSDLVSVDDKIVCNLDFVWCLAAELLSDVARKELADWYREIFLELTGEALPMPCLSLAQRRI